MEHGKDASPDFASLLKGATVEQMTGTIGAEVRGVQLSKLDKAGKDELALFTAIHKVVGRSKIVSTISRSTTNYSKHSDTKTLPTCRSATQLSTDDTSVACTSIPRLALLLVSPKSI